MQRTKYQPLSTRTYWAPLLLSFLLVASANSQDRSGKAGTPLLTGQAVHKQIKAQESHGYSFRVERDYFVQVAVESKGVDVALTLRSPGGKQTTRSPDNLGDGTSEASLCLIADTEGEMSLQVFGLRSSAAAGTYTIKLALLRPAQEVDRKRVAAETLILEGAAFARTATAESRLQAIERFQAAIPLLEQANAKARLGVVFNRLGRNYNFLGDRQKAIENYEKAFKTRQEIDDKVGQARVLSDIGFAYSSAGEFQKALDYQSQSLALRRALKDPRLESHVLYQIGIIYSRLGEPEKALTYFSQALPVIRAAGETLDEARVLNNMGAAYYSLGLREQALTSLTRCLELENATANQLVIRIVLWRLAIVHFNLGHLEKARELFNQALELEQKYGDPTNKADIFTGLGEVSYQLNEQEHGRAFFEQALPLLRATQNRTGEAKVHYWLARIEADNKNPDAALGEIEAAIRIVEAVRSGLVAPEFRTSYFATVGKYYELYVEILWQLNSQRPNAGFAEKSLRASEQSRARSLIELLNEGKIDIRQDVSAALLARERELQKQLNRQAAAQAGIGGERATNDHADAALKELEETGNALVEIEAEIRRQSPHYAALTQPQTLSLKEIQATLDQDTVLLEYKLGDAGSFLWAVSQTGLRTSALPSRTIIEPLARRLYQLLTERNRRVPNENEAQAQRRITGAEIEYREVAAQLSRLLLGPVAPTLKSQRLVIVTDGALQYIPFGALPENRDSAVDGHESRDQSTAAAGPRNLDAVLPLIANHEIVNLPSASVIAVLRREAAARKPTTKAVAIFADPVFAKDDIRVTVAQRKERPGPTNAQRDLDSVEWLAEVSAGGAEKQPAPALSITRLPFSRREANAILAFAPANETYVALDFEANRANATSPALSQYGILHFATHGWLNSARPELSGVVLSLVDRKGQGQDGILRLHEIYNLELNANLVVLSACQTALGKEVKGEGLIGLTRGFMYAGAPRVAASLWKVDDAATAELMAHFYRSMLRDKRSAAAALRAAQLELIKQKRWNAPYFWAGFILQGEWR